jgi:peptidoglycan/LPS O-acetylase OafA/YrhL
MSYSVYLLHPLILQVVRKPTVDPSGISLPVRLVRETVLFTTVIGCATLSYRFIEKPAQGLGRSLVGAAGERERHGPPQEGASRGDRSLIGSSRS